MSAQSIAYYENVIADMHHRLQEAEEALKQVSQMLHGEYEASTRLRSRLSRIQALVNGQSV